MLVDNKDQKLLPGMTANATIASATANNALVVPTAALSFVPTGTGARRGGKRPAGATGTAAAPAAAKPAGTTTAPAAGAASASPWGTTTGSAATVIAAGSDGHVFVQRNGKLARIPVHIDLVANGQAAVTATGSGTQTLAAGDAVVTGTNGGTATRKTAASTNPFQSQQQRVPGGARGGPRS